MVERENTYLQPSIQILQILPRTKEVTQIISFVFTNNAQILLNFDTLLNTSHSFHQQWPSDAVAGSTFTQITVCYCLTASNHESMLLNGWSVIDEVRLRSFECNVMERYLSHQSLKLAWQFHSNLTGSSESENWLIEAEWRIFVSVN